MMKIDNSYGFIIKQNQQNFKLFLTKEKQSASKVFFTQLDNLLKFNLLFIILAIILNAIFIFTTIESPVFLGLSTLPYDVIPPATKFTLLFLLLGNIGLFYFIEKDYKRHHEANCGHFFELTPSLYSYGNWFIPTHQITAIEYKGVMLNFSKAIVFSYGDKGEQFFQPYLNPEEYQWVVDTLNAYLKHYRTEIEQAAQLSPELESLAPSPRSLTSLVFQGGTAYLTLPVNVFWYFPLQIVILLLLAGSALFSSFIDQILNELLHLEWSHSFYLTVHMLITKGSKSYFALFFILVWLGGLGASLILYHLLKPLLLAYINLLPRRVLAVSKHKIQNGYQWLKKMKFIKHLNFPSRCSFSIQIVKRKGSYSHRSYFLIIKQANFEDSFYLYTDNTGDHLAYYTLDLCERFQK